VNKVNNIIQSLKIARPPTLVIVTAHHFSDFSCVFDSWTFCSQNCSAK